MNYINKIIEFLTQYNFIILPCISFALLLYSVVNFCKNVYRKQNKKIIATTRKICSYPDKTAQFVTSLPQEYQRQWRAFVNGNASQPSLVFEFVTLKNKIYLLRLVIIAAILSSCYIVVFAFNTARADFLIFQIAFWLAFTLVTVADRFLYKYNGRKAKMIFARLVNELNRNATKEQTKEEKFEDTVKQIKQLQKCEPTNAVFDRASELLHSKGLNADRTVSEQRKLNSALNGLLQSYTKT